MPSIPNPDCSVSVIICTHNPRRDYLQRVLDALRGQTLGAEQWELLLIDNASKEPVAGKFDLNWHAQGRHVREDEVGLTAARLRGIRESRSELLLFVDDDNVLAADYLEQAVKIGRSFEFIGAWGGCIEHEFEIVPPEWTRPFWSYLAMRSLERSYWTNITTDGMLVPCGAGLCVRRKVAEGYARKTATDEQAMKLDRKGDQLLSCGDVDMILTGCDLGYGYGIFIELRMTHLIHKGRLTEEYLLRLLQGSTFSFSLLQARRGGGPLPAPVKPGWRRKLGALRRRLMMGRIDRLAMEAYMRGAEEALAVVKQNPGGFPSGQQKKSPMSAIPWRR